MDQSSATPVVPLDLSVRRMRTAGQSEAAVAAFTAAFARLCAGDLGELPSATLEPVPDVPELEDLPEHAGPLDQVAVIKLNGGLGTSMGLAGPKSLLEIREGVTFLDVMIRQARSFRRQHRARSPLVLMNSFATRERTLAALRRYPEMASDVPEDFVQSMVPRLRVEDLAPVEWPAEPRLEWCPPGHGDLYAALSGTRMLSVLLERGYRYAFVSNGDNVGAVLDPRILGWMSEERIPFVMEVVTGTEADRKGGHIARQGDRLVLRETAQTPLDDASSFGDFRRWRYYNTNNLWLDLAVLADSGPPSLPLIVNRKRVDPRDAGSPEVLQLESAMGSALSSIDGARVVRVPRSRFAPVKTTDDRLVRRSDVYRFDADGLLVTEAPPPYVALDRRHFGAISDFETRFLQGPPSLARCTRLVINGDVSFGRDVTIEGEVYLQGPLRVPDGATLR